MNALTRTRMIRWLAWGGLVIVSGYLGMRVITALMRRQAETPFHTPAAPSPLKYEQVIQGLNYQSLHEGRKVFTLKADRIRLQKKKIGFLR